MKNGKYLWIFGAIIAAMLLLQLFAEDWLRGSDAEPVPFAEIAAEERGVDGVPCVYYWKVEGLAQLTRQLPEQEAGPYPVKPQPVYVAFYPVAQTVFTEGLTHRDDILKRITLPPSFVLGQWDPTYPPRISFLRRECPTREKSTSEPQ
jgi:hypothetical protein